MVNSGSIIERLFRRIIKFLKKKFAQEVLVLGDSHVAVFDFFSPKVLITDFLKYKFNVCSIGGATTSGLKNKNSKTQTMNKFLNKISLFNGNHIILMLGEVDMGFVIWMKSESSRVPINSFYDKALKNYCDLIDELKTQHTLLVISAPLPTIKDGNVFGEVSMIRSKITARQKKRTDITLKFNVDVGNHCTNNQIKFINLDQDSIGLNGLVRNSLLNKDPSDHHYDMQAYCNLLKIKVKKALNN